MALFSANFFSSLMLFMQLRSVTCLSYKLKRRGSLNQTKREQDATVKRKLKLFGYDLLMNKGLYLMASSENWSQYLNLLTRCVVRYLYNPTESLLLFKPSPLWNPFERSGRMTPPGLGFGIYTISFTGLCCPPPPSPMLESMLFTKK